MDAQTILGIFGAMGLFLTVGIAIGRQASTRKDIADLDHRVHRLSNRLQAIPEHPDEVYARRDTVALELKHVRESQTRMEGQLATLVSRLP